MYNRNMKFTNLSSVQKKYKGMWVAFTDNLTEVIVANKNANVVYKKAIEMGYKKPTLFKIPENIVPYIGIS